MTINTRLAEFKPDLALSDIGFPGKTPDRGIYRNGAKRLVETLLVLLTAPVTLPLVLLMALLVACDGGNPFFVQKRLGRNGRVFRIWKLRSMVVDAERRLAAHLEQDPAARDQWDSTQKLKQDPRVTRVGRLLRKSSMDELPQLLNVLSGEMSLVGPRPVVNAELDYYGASGKYYLATRPGLTGLWQISGRSDTTYAERVRLDRFYVANWGLLRDLRIVVMTVPAILMSRGAH